MNTAWMNWLMMMSVLVPNFAYAADPQGNATGYEQSMREKLRFDRKRFYWLGVCVGQNLAQQGVTLPTPGQSPQANDIFKGALLQARQACKPTRSSNPGANPVNSNTSAANCTGSGSGAGSGSSSGTSTSTGTGTETNTNTNTGSGTGSGTYFSFGMIAAPATSAEES